MMKSALAKMAIIIVFALLVCRDARADEPSPQRETVSCRYVKSLGREMILYTFGQSNAANSVVGDRYKSVGPVFAFDWKTGNCYRAQDPLPGTDGDGGSPWVRLGDQIIKAGMADTVVIIAAAVSSSYIKQWAPGGDLDPHLRSSLTSALKAGFTPNYLLWHQGEAEGNNTQMRSKEYIDLFHKMLHGIRSIGVKAPVFVAKATLCDTWRFQNPPLPHFPNRDEIRSAQAALVDRSRGIFAGPDTDTIGVDQRYADCHFTPAGNIRHAALWFEAIKRTIH